MKHFTSLAILCFLVFNTAISSSQKSNKFPLWTFHDNDVAIFGASIGAFTTLNSNLNTTTHGVRVEALGSELLPLFVQSTLRRLFKTDTNFNLSFGKNFDTTNATVSEKINGISFSTFGSFSYNHVNGISINGFLGSTLITNGFSISAFQNVAGTVSGLQLSLASNKTEVLNGLQVSVVNFSNFTSGMQAGLINMGGLMNGIQIGLINLSDASNFQIGLFNRNGNRFMPFINF